MVKVRVIMMGELIKYNNKGKNIRKIDNRELNNTIFIGKVSFLEKWGCKVRGGNNMF